MSDHKFTVIIAGHGVSNAGEITLKLDDVTLDPAKYDDWLNGGRYLKLADPANFNGWVSWSNQAKDMPKPANYLERMQSRWDSFTEVVTGHAPVTDFTPTIEGQAGELATSTKNAIAAALDRFTDISGNAVHVTDLAGLQAALNDLIPSPPVAAEVLQAKGNTLIELVQMGLMTDEDMANHLADCASNLAGQPFTAKRIMSILTGLRDLQDLVYGLNEKAGWWSDLETGEPKIRNKGELMMLMVTEIAEGYEGVRKNLMDDKLQYRPMEEVEIGDMIIRGVDYTGGHRLDIGGAILHKLLFNQLRADHKREHRMGVNGKKT